MLANRYWELKLEKPLRSRACLELNSACLKYQLLGPAASTFPTVDGKIHDVTPHHPTRGRCVAGSSLGTARPPSLRKEQHDPHDPSVLDPVELRSSFGSHDTLVPGSPPAVW